MSGLSFPSKGPGGIVAARGPWFGLVPDKLNLLFPGDATSGITSPVPANYGNQWETVRTTLGGFITAPDGTTNKMQLIQEDTSNNTHYVNGFVRNGIGGNTAALRFAVFASNGGRRLSLSVMESNLIGGVRAIFDLAGGQIGVAAATFGSTNNQNVYTPIDTQMVFVGTFLGNAVYLCWMDYTFFNPDAGLTAQNWLIQLDNGTGTNAASVSYTGNGSSGVYVWKTNLMPAGAYAINTQTLFDDFTSTSTIDMTNSLAPGFNWYKKCTFNGLFQPNGGNTNNPTPNTAFSVAGSVLTLNSTNSWNSGNDNQVMLTSAAQLDYTQGTYVGRGYNIPALFESSSSWNFGTAADYHVSMWGGGLEWVMGNLKTSNPVLTSFERDMAPNIEAPGIYPNTGWLFWPNPGANGGGLADPIGLGSGGIASTGPGLFSVNINYGTPGLTTELGGQQYFGDATAFPGAPPNAHWTATNYPASFSYPVLVVDYTQFHTYSNLVIPVRYPGWAGPNAQQSCAVSYSFFDGGGCGSASASGAAFGWRPQGSPIRAATAGASSDFLTSVEWQQQILWLNTNHNTTSHDWIRVTQ